MEHYEGPESGKKLLQDNGFVVVPDFQRRVFVPYFNEDLPHFVTADSVLQTYHVIFEDELKGLDVLDMHPAPDIILRPGDYLVVFASLEALARVHEMSGSRPGPSRRDAGTPRRRSWLARLFSREES